MRIGEISARTGVSVRMLRYYEEQGLLAPPPSLTLPYAMLSTTPPSTRNAAPVVADACSETA